MKLTRLGIYVLIGFVSGLSSITIDAADDVRPQFLMFSDPELKFPKFPSRLSDRLLPLWRQALQRPESDMRRLAADAIATAHREGFAGMDAAIPDLVKLVEQADTDASARWQAAHTLIALDARTSADLLLQASQRHGMDLRMLIEPALAEWDFAAAREVWRQRVRDTQAGRRDLILAVNGLGRVRDRDSLDSLLEITMSNRQPTDIRLAAARAAGTIADSGLEAQANELVQRKPANVLNRLCSVAFLTRHSSEPALQQLAQLGRDAEPSVAAGALRILQSIDPALVLPLAEESVKNGDANVRLIAIETFAAFPTSEHVAVLGRSLDDRHPNNRGVARKTLLSWAARPELADPVRSAATTGLGSASWRSQEQAALIVAALDYEPAAPRLIELLESPRREVMIATAWALKTLAVSETAPALLDKATRQDKQPQPASDPDAVNDQLSHLFEAMAVLDHSAAIPLLRKYVPKNLDLGNDTRGAAIWALGHLYKKSPDEALAQQFTERLTDNGMPAEVETVRRMSAISIGRMKVKSQLDALKRYAGPDIDHLPVEYSIDWALREMGDSLPYAKILESNRVGWFLEPAE